MLTALSPLLDANMYGGHNFGTELSLGTSTLENAYSNTSSLEVLLTYVRTYLLPYLLTILAE